MAGTAINRKQHLCEVQRAYLATALMTFRNCGAASMSPETSCTSPSRKISAPPVGAVLYRWLVGEEITLHDNNLVFNTHGGEYPVCSDYQGNAPLGTASSPSVQWQQLGFDVHSVIADPMFVDPEHDDYRLKPESPAFTLGFQAIDFTKIGPADAP